MSTPPQSEVVPVSTPPAPAVAPAPAPAPTTPPTPARAPAAEPPVGAKPSIATTPVQVGTSSAKFRPVAATRPKVERYDVITHRALQEDTWASLSQRYFRTERYAETLQAYNRQNPQASDRLRRDGRPAPGDDVYIPPTWLLEERHGTLLRPEEVR